MRAEGFKTGALEQALLSRPHREVVVSPPDHQEVLFRHHQLDYRNA